MGEAQRRHRLGRDPFLAVDNCPSAQDHEIALLSPPHRHPPRPAIATWRIRRIERIACGRLSPPAVRRRRCRRSPRDRDAHRASGRRPTSPSRNTPACARAASPRGCRAMSRRLQILSASFTSFARRLMVAACSTCRRLRSSFGNDLSSVTSITMSATSLPNSRSSSCSVVSVSSTVSCNTAATITRSSSTPASLASTSASAIG